MIKINVLSLTEVFTLNNILGGFFLLSKKKNNSHVRQHLSVCAGKCPSLAISLQECPEREIFKQVYLIVVLAV